jgi:predicted ester cyclase
VNVGDLESLAQIIDEVVLPDAQIRTPLPIDAMGAEKLKQVWSMLFSIYPDLHLTVDDLIAAGDKVVTRNTVTGTQRGEFMGTAPTGKSVTYNEIFIFRFVDGRVAETWGVVDVYAQMRQIGVVSP